MDTLPRPENPSSQPLTDAFHRHLDECEQCACFPFELCPEGEILIKAASIENKLKLSRSPFTNDGARL